MDYEIIYKDGKFSTERYKPNKYAKAVVSKLGQNIRRNAESKFKKIIKKAIFKNKDLLPELKNKSFGNEIECEAYVKRYIRFRIALVVSDFNDTNYNKFKDGVKKDIENISIKNINKLLSISDVKFTKDKRLEENNRKYYITSLSINFN